MNRLIYLLCAISLNICFPVLVYAETVANAVVISFADRTSSAELHASEIIEQSILANLMEVPQIALMEHYALPDTMALESEINNPLESISKIVENNDFQRVLQATKNDIRRKHTGNLVSPAKTQAIGERYHADYLIHGTIDYLGKERKETTIPIPGAVFNFNSPYLEALVTIRIIRADTGRIVWCKQEKGVSKEGLLRYKDMKPDKTNDVIIGSKDSYDTMFMEAMEKIGVKIVKALKQDILDKKLIL